MTDKIAVVKPAYAEEEAYELGYKRFEGLDADERGDFDLSHFKESAEWANSVAPKLRAKAGFGDSGTGTYRRGRQVAAIMPGCEEDEPAVAQVLDASFLFNDLVDAFDKGARDAAHGREKELPDEWSTPSA